MRSVKILLVCLVAILVFSTLAYAEVPRMINYQGKITTPQGALISDTFSMVFSIYSDSTGGTALWTETQTAVKVEYGVFSVLLGSVNPIPATVFDGHTRYLGLKVGNDAEMAPRKAIVSVGYAYHSGIADTAYFAMPDADWIIVGDTIYHLNGNVGIGTTSPASNLDIRGVVQAVDDGTVPDTKTYSSFGVTRANVATNNSYLGLTKQSIIPWGIGIDAGDKFIIGVASSSPARTIPSPLLSIDPDIGNVGIGTTGPAYKLDVNGDIRATGTIYGNSDIWDGHHWGDTYPYSSNSDMVDGVHNGGLTADVWDGHHWGDTYPYASNSDLVDGIHGTQFLRNDQSGTLSGNLNVTGGIQIGPSLDAQLSLGGSTSTAATIRNVSASQCALWVSNGGSGEAIAAGNQVSGATYVVHVIGFNNATSSKGLWVRGQTLIEGNFQVASGTKNAVVPTSQGMTKVYSQESPEVWFEDFGEAELTNGKAHIEIDPLFLETVTIDQNHLMKVFVTLNDDCNGIYVKRGHTGFDVIELNSGKSDAHFSYRVVAKRKGFEDERLEKVEQELSNK